MSESRLSRETSGSPGRHSNNSACIRPSAIGISHTGRGWPLQSAHKRTISPRV
ncbi:Uncharacterised protein [Bordetella pertussis]|nr:Uncharacterised protein [Bordetella pertussis]